MPKAQEILVRFVVLAFVAGFALAVDMAVLRPGVSLAQTDPADSTYVVAAAAQGLYVADGSQPPAPSISDDDQQAAAAATPPKPLPKRLCSDRLQTLVNAADAGAVLTVGGHCVYRETVTITKPLTLVAKPGTEIRGSDVWQGWTRQGRNWVKGTLPVMIGGGTCQGGGNGCRAREQVFFDGLPLRQVASNPTSGQFAVDASRNVLLNDDPRQHTVEVSTRSQWIFGQSDNVVLQQWRMRHATNDAQTGALSPGGHSNWTIQDNVLSDAHGAVVEIARGTGHGLLRNDISRGGQLGVMGGNGLVQANRIHDNNVDGFDPGWEAGGLKAAATVRGTWDNNEVDHNQGPGLWCDIRCQDITITSNRTHHNLNAGIFFEVSRGATIVGNTVWENGWGYPAWAWGGGIILSSSANVEVAWNVLAWNADGISIVSQSRSDGIPSRNQYVHDNTVATTDSALDTDSNLALGWVQDWNGGMFDLSSNNRGQLNGFWYPAQEPGYTRFGWNGPVGRLAELDRTPAGGGNSRYLTVTEKDHILTAAGVPLAPEPR